MGPKPLRAKLRFRKNPSFVIVYSDGSEKWFTRKVSKQAANEILIRINDRIALGSFEFEDFAPVKNKVVRFLTFAKEYLTYRDKQKNLGNLSRATVEKDFYSLNIFGKWYGKDRPIHLINTKTIEDFRLYLLTEAKTLQGKNYSKNSINGYIKHLSSAFEWACNDMRYIRDNPFKKIKPLQTKIEKRIYKTGEIELLRNEFAIAPQRWKLDIFNLALWTGMRRSEIIQIKESDIKELDIPGKKSAAFLKVQGKGNKIRFVPLGPKALELLKERIEILNNEGQNISISQVLYINLSKTVGARRFELPTP